MKTLYRIIIAVMLFSFMGCYPMISGRVVDAETGKPLEGAVARAEWHHEKGLPGLSYTELGKTAESVTDSKGKFRMAGAFPFFAPSVLVVYKKGYIAWREYAVFPSYEKRKDCCRNGFPSVFRLERFVEGAYPHSHHTSYIRSGISGGALSKLEQAYMWEFDLTAEEEDLYRQKMYDKKHHENIWKEVLQELYSTEKENKNEQK